MIPTFLLLFCRGRGLTACMKQDPQRYKALLATIVCHVIWGFSFMFSRVALDRVPVFQLLSHRFILAFLAMNLVLFTGRFRLDLKKKGIRLLLLLGLMEPVVYFIGEQYGILHSSTIFSGVMIATIPIAATLAAWPFIHERPTAGQLLFSLVSVGGVIGIGLLSSSTGTLDWIGLAALLISVASATAYSLITRSISGRYTPFERTYVMMGIAASVFTPLGLVQTQGSLSAYLAPLSDLSYLGAVFFLGILASVVCFFLSGYALTYLTVARESVFSNLTTAVSVFAGAVFLREPFSWLSLLFCFLILFGIWGVQRTSKQ